MARCDLVTLVADSWKADGPRLSPRELAEWTPHQLLAVFFTRRDSASGGGADNVELLARHNAARAARGLRPVSPSWFLPGLQGA